MAPTFVTSATTPNWTSTSAQTTGSVTVQTGDLLVVKAGGSDGRANPSISNSGAALTWTLQESLTTGGSALTKVWTATADSDRSLTVTLTPAAAYACGGSVEAWRGHNGVGAAESRYDTSGIDIAITTTAANSALTMIISDANEIDGSSRSYLTVNVAATELVYNYTGTAATEYVAYWSDAGTAGAKTAGQAWHGACNAGIAVIEIKSAVGGSVTAVKTNISVAAVAPEVSAATVVTGGGPAAVTVAALAPTVQGGSAGNVAAVVAAVSVAGRAPAVSGGATVVAPRPDMFAAALAPGVSGGGGVVAPVAAATVAGVAPTVIGGASVQVPRCETVTARAVAPGVKGIKVTIHFYPPTVDEGPIGGGRLFSFFKMPRGVSVLLTDGVAVERRFPTSEEVVAADVAYIGGYNYVITREAADVLVAAGYTPTIEERE